MLNYCKNVNVSGGIIHGFNFRDGGAIYRLMSPRKWGTELEHNWQDLCPLPSPPVQPTTAAFINVKQVKQPSLFILFIRVWQPKAGLNTVQYRYNSTHKNHIVQEMWCSYDAITSNVLSILKSQGYFIWNSRIVTSRIYRVFGVNMNDNCNCLLASQQKFLKDSSNTGKRIKESSSRLHDRGALYQ